MRNAAGNQAIVNRMRAAIHGHLLNAAQSAAAPCSGFTLTDFSVTNPNNELMVLAAVTGAPAGATLFGVTVAVAPSASSPVTYCMAVATDTEGLQLPVSLLAASTAPALNGPATVTGLVVLSFALGGAAQQECVVTQQFPIGG